MERAEVDHIEGSTAVLLIGDRMVGVPLDELPTGTREGTHLWVTLVEHEVVEAEIDYDATQSSRKRMTSELRRLRESQSSDDEEGDPVGP